MGPNELFFQLSFEDRVRFAQAFEVLKKVCDKLALTPDEENAECLKNVLGNLKTDVLQGFSDYILVPIFIHLSNKKLHKTTTLCQLLECLCTLLERITIEEGTLFWKMFSLILLQIDEETKPNQTSTSPEELKLNATKALTLLFKRAKISLLEEEIYTRKHYSKLSAAIFASIQIAKREKYVTLRIQAMEFILNFLQVQECSKNLTFRSKVGDIVMLMVPGIMAFCLETANTTEIVNHKIVLLAVRIWGRTIGLVIDDSLLPKTTSRPKVFKINSAPKKYSFNTNPGNLDEVKRIIEGQVRDENWLITAGGKLEKAVAHMVDLQQHEHWKVRKQLVIEVDYILSSSSKIMLSSLGHLIDTLIVLSQDEHVEVVKLSKRGLERFSENCKKTGERDLVEIVEDCFYSLLTKLPRILHGVNLSLKEKQLLLLGGYLDILGSAYMPKIINSAQHLNRLLKCIYIAARLDCSHISLLEEISIKDMDEGSTISDSVWKQLKFCCTKKSALSLEHICKKLFDYSDRMVVIHYLLDEFNSNVQYRKEVTLIFHYVLTQDTPSAFSCYEDILRNVLISLMEQDIWNLPLTVGKGEARTRKEAQENVVQICLLNETVASLAHALGKDVFAPLLLRCLYPLLECAGSPLFALSVAGLQAVNRVANLYGGGVGELVANNVDYLSHHVTNNLRHAQKNPKVLSVLSVIMKHSNMNVLPSLYDIVNDVLLQSCDAFQEVNASAFLHVFHTFVSCLHDWLKEIEPKGDDENKVEKPKTLSILEELMEYHKATVEANMWKSEDTEDTEVKIKEDLEDEDEYVDNLKEDKKIIPDYIKFTTQILNRTLHFVPSKDVSRQIIALQILEKGILILSPWENELLPITHKIWSPLVERFYARNNPLLIHRAFSLLVTLGKTSKDFIRSRTMKEAMPRICQVLKKSSESSKKQKAGGAYVLSLQYKMQLALLNGIGVLCRDLDLLEKEIESILDSIDPYLSKAQPHSLQNACVESYLEISLKDPNCVWVHLMSLSSNNFEFSAPIPDLQNFKIRGRFLETEEYENNIKKLLDQI